MHSYPHEHYAWKLRSAEAPEPSLSEKRIVAAALARDIEDGKLSGAWVAAKTELAIKNHVAPHVIEHQLKLLRGNKPSRRAQAYDERRQVTAEAMAAAAEEEEGKGTAGLTDRSKRRRVSGLAWVYVPTDAQTGAIQSGSKEATEIANHVRMIQGRGHKRVVANLQQQIDTLNGKLEQSKERIDDLREETAELLPQAKKAKSLAARKDTLTQKLAGKDEELKEKKREVNMANQDRREQAKRARSAELAVERTEGKLEAVKANMEDAGERAKEKWQEKVDKEKKMKNEARQRAREAELRPVRSDTAAACSTFV